MKKIIKRDTNFYLDIENPTPDVQPVVLFGVKAQQQSTPGSTVYSWDFTAGLAAAADFFCQELVLIARANTPLSLFSYYNYFTGTPFASINDILTGLNTLGLGTFTISSGNIITVTNSNYIFASVSITNAFFAQSTLPPAGSAAEFASLGSLIYNPGYTPGLIGGLTRINPANSFWINAGMTDVDGPFNRNSCSVTFQSHMPIPYVPVDEQVGWFAQVNAPATGTYYIGFSALTAATIFINGVQIVKLFDAAITASNANIQSITGLVSPQPTSLDPFWYIIPVTLQAGVNLIQFLAAHNTGINYSAAMEIYNNTAAEIAAATDYSTLDVLFQSSSVRGSTLY